jgi:signal peptidase I
MPNGFTDANGRAVKEGDEVEYRDGRRGVLTYCGHDGAAWVKFATGDEDVNWRNLCAVPKT